MLHRVRTYLRRKLYPDVRILRLDPHVRVGFTPLPERMSDAAYDELYQRRVARNEQRRCEAKEERVLAFLRPQAI